MRDIRIEKLAKSLLEHSIGIKENDNLLIEVLGEEAMPLAKALMKEASRLKAKPFFNIVNYPLLRVMLEEATEEQIKLYAEIDIERMKKMDAYIGIRANANTAELTGIDSKIMEIYNKYYTGKVHFEERVKNTKWCILRYPNNSMAQMSNMSLEKFEDFYFNVCTVDYAKMSKAMDNLVELMNKTDKVRIVSSNTDLNFSIKGITAEKYYGTYNIPDGEVATAPVRDSINGYITYNTESSYNGNLFNNIKFEFEKGKIVNATANDTKKLNDILDTDDGARYIGEFAIGLNPYVDKAIGDTLFDEKIRGSFHFTPGDALEESDNGNRSAIHWDLVSIQTKEYGGGEIWFDDVLIRKDGIFVIKELESLNPENLM
ncbi:MAG: aminopeptidase [Oscillospiraceae bacterium]|nr:aminopeptidase [Oscillospiraceae bacterium]